MTGLETAIVGLCVTLGAALIIWAARSFGEWLRTPYDFKKSRHLPQPIRSLRRWMTSEPREKLTPTQWVNWYFGCPTSRHVFPRDLPDNGGRWNDGETWYGRCKKCRALVEASSEPELDAAEMDGKGVPRRRKPTAPLRWRNSPE